MSIAFTDRGVALCILLGMFALVFLYWGIARYRIRRIFGPRRQDSSVLEPVRRQLEKVNAECRRFVFSAERVTNVSLGGHRFQLVYGLVGFVESMQGGTGMRVYAMAEGDEIVWMRNFPDVFELADSTATSAVFWVKLPVLMRLTRQYGRL
jgi:hypothetical protein